MRLSIDEIGIFKLRHRDRLVASSADYQIKQRRWLGVRVIAGLTNAHRNLGASALLSLAFAI